MNILERVNAALDSVDLERVVPGVPVPEGKWIQFDPHALQGVVEAYRHQPEETLRAVNDRMLELLEHSVSDSSDTFRKSRIALELRRRLEAGRHRTYTEAARGLAQVADRPMVADEWNA